MMERRTPQEIESESMRIIDSEAGGHGFGKDEWRVVRRVIHATADFDFVKTIRFHPDAVSRGVQAVRGGAPIYTDTEMLAAAMGHKAAAGWGCPILCCIADEDVRDESLRTGETRSAIAVRKAAPELDQGIIAVGNAPTALHQVIDLFEKKSLVPALVIGMPVGFVEALESKERLYRSGLAGITNLDRKGGTPAAAAVLNALLRLAAERASQT